MEPSRPRSNQYLQFILIAMAVMIVVMAILLVFVYRTSSKRSEAVETNAASTSNFQDTVEAIVAATLQTTESPVQLGDDEEIITEEDNEIPVETGKEPVPDSEEEMQASETVPPTFTPSSLSPDMIAPKETETPIAWVEEKLASLTLPQKVGQMILTGVNGAALTPDTCQFIRRISPGGVIYIGSNTSGSNPSQLRDLSEGLQNCIKDSVGIPLVISIDHEGPYVNRFPYDSQMTTFPPAMAIGATMKPELAYKAALASGQELRTAGVNMVLGPVADVLTNYDNTVISQRSYGGDPNVVNTFVSKAVQGYLEAGILPVLKHYPGHGGVSGDSHSILPVDHSDEVYLLGAHLVPFQGGIDAGAPSVMVSHVAFPSIDTDNLPASLSSDLYELLDEKLGFQGISMSDSMGMGAVGTTGLSIESASITAVNAGLDMLMLVSPDLAESVYSSVLWAAQSGDISEQRIDHAVRKILTVKFNHGLSAFPLQHVPTPDWNANIELAFTIGYQAVSGYKNESDLVPIPPSVNKVLVVGPTDGWGLYPLLRSAFDQRGITYNILTFTGYWFGPVPDTNLLQAVPNRASNYDMVIIFTWDAHPNRFLFGDTFQAQLVNSLVSRGFNPVVIALKSPTDIIEFPDVGTFLATMGTTSGQLQAIIDALVGDGSPLGNIPLSNLP